MPIPEKATEIHGITDEDVRDAPGFNEIAKSLARDFEGCDLAGYNSVRFDIPLLAEEFLRAGVDIDLKRKKFVDVQVIFMKMEPRTLSAAYKFFTGGELNEAHSAAADTRATYEVLQAQLDRYENLENDVASLAEFSAHNRNVDFAGRIVYDDQDVEIFNFGKYKGRPVREILAQDPGYYGWMMNGDFPLYTKKVLTSIKLNSMNK
jgi:DNA polymerase-3 subunit epsilon